MKNLFHILVWKDVLTENVHSVLSLPSRTKRRKWSDLFHPPAVCSCDVTSCVADTPLPVLNTDHVIPVTNSYSDYTNIERNKKTKKTKKQKKKRKEKKKTNSLLKQRKSDSLHIHNYYEDIFVSQAKCELIGTQMHPYLFRIGTFQSVIVWI